MILMMIHSGAIAAEFYVSPQGDDKNPGTKEKPFQTITRARDSVKKINGKMGEDITVHLGNGTYELSVPVVFGADDSGMNGHKVIYKASEGNTPVVSGGRRIKPNYKNTFERNYHMCPLARIIEKENTVRDNVEVKKGTDWPTEAQKIIKTAGPRGRLP